MRENRKKIMNYFTNQKNLENFINHFCETLNANTILYRNILQVLHNDFEESEAINMDFFNKMDAPSQFMYLLDFQLSILKDNLIMDSKEFGITTEKKTEDNVH